MPRFDELAPDQKAVLQLLLKQGKSYADIAGLLRLESASVRERALDALDALGAEAPSADELAPEHQDELADHLLLQQSASEREHTRELLATSAAGRAWARAVAGELQGVAGDALPEIPSESEVAAKSEGTAAPEPAAGSRGTAEPAIAAGSAASSGSEAFDRPADAFDDDGPAAERRPRSSKLGGILILAAVGAVLALGLILLLRKDDGSSSASSAAADAPVVAAATCSSGTTGTPAQQQVNLKAPTGANQKALGFAIVQQGGMQLVVQGLDRSNLYKVWLWNSPSDAVPLGFATYQTKTKRLVGAVQAFPAGTAACRTLVITRERSQSAATPGPIVQSGTLKRS